MMMFYQLTDYKIIIEVDWIFFRQTGKHAREIIVDIAGYYFELI